MLNSITKLGQMRSKARFHPANAGLNAASTRVELGLAHSPQEIEALKLFAKRLKIWLLVSGSTEADDVKRWLVDKPIQFKVEIYTMSDVAATVSQLPR